MLRRVMPNPDLAARVAILTILATLVMWFGQGCAAADNDRTSVGGESLPSIGASEQPEICGTGSGGTGVPPVSEPAASGTAASGLDRRTWAPITIVVAGDATQHHPRYTTNQPAYARSTPRRRGEHPTASSSLDLGSRADDEAQVWELWAAPFHAAANVVMFIPRAFRHPPGSIVVSPDGAYERYPTARPAGCDVPSPPR